MPENAAQAAHYRTGNRNERNIYLVVPNETDTPDELHVACVFDPADGPHFVHALNRGLRSIQSDQEEG